MGKLSMSMGKSVVLRIALVVLGVSCSLGFRPKFSTMTVDDNAALSLRHHAHGLVKSQFKAQPGPHKHALFYISKFYNRHRYVWWNPILDFKDQDTKIILGQLPDIDTWKNYPWPGEELVAKANFTNGFAGFVDEYEIRAVVAAVEDFEWKNANQQGRLEAALQKRDVPFKRLRMADFGKAKVELLSQGVAFMEDQFKRSPNKRIYVHCKAGRGRSAAVVVAYLSKTRKINPAIAHFMVRRSRPHINVDKPKVRDLHEFYRKEVLMCDESDKKNPCVVGTELPSWMKRAVKLHYKLRDALWAEWEKQRSLLKKLKTVLSVETMLKRTPNLRKLQEQYEAVLDEVRPTSMAL